MEPASDRSLRRFTADRPDSGLTDRQFERFRDLVQSTCGIRMTPQKRSMLEARLRKRLRALGLECFEAYEEWLFSPEGEREEVARFVDAVTTNKTDFYREARHFDFLRETVLPRLAAERGIGFGRPFRAWSAGCSSGEEAYTLAMVLAEFGAGNPGFDFEVTATDISNGMLEKARLGIYREERVSGLPEGLKRRFLMRSRDRLRGEVRIVPELRSRVRFGRLNFLEEPFGFREPFDLAFCRNVLIYFERDTQVRVLRAICRHLGPERYLMTGHSETLHGLNLPLTQVAPSVYLTAAGSRRP